MPTADEWYSLGAVKISEGVPEFPSLPNFPAESIPTTKVVPGVYRLTFDNGYIYIGKAKNLRLRFGNYRKPTSGTEQEHVIRYILLDAGGATVAVIPESNEITRHALEKAELTAAIKAGKPLLNSKRLTNTLLGRLHRSNGRTPKGASSQADARILLIARAPSATTGGKET